MGSARGGLKGFYKQKKNGGISKATAKATATAKAKASKPSSIKGKSPANSATPASIDLILRDGYGESENMLRKFDTNTAYGPCVGITRMARWERACSLGLNPPKDIETLLKAGKVQLECLWGSRV